jgi:hypothetical protein
MKKRPKHPPNNQQNKKLVFEKINKTDKPQANLTKMRREKTQTSKIRNKKGEIPVNTKEIIRDYFEKLYSNKLKNLKEMDKILDSYGHQN